MTPGRIFVLLILVVGAVGTVVNGAVFYVRLFYVGAGLLVIAWLMTFLSLRGIRVERQSRSQRGSVGDIFEEHFDIYNTSLFPTLWLEIANESPIPNTAGSRVLTLLRGRQKRSYTARSWLTTRGGFALGPTRLTSGDPFGIFRVTRVLPPKDRLVVLPMQFRMEQFVSPAGLLPGGKAIRRKSLDITPHAAGVREYVAGDPMKRIHWPTSIRRDQLMVKEFEQDPQSEVWFFLDTHLSAHSAKPIAESAAPPIDDLLLLRRHKIKLPPSTMEYAVTITASLAHYFLQQRRSVGMVTASERTYEIIPAERSERQEAKLLEALAFLQAASTFTLPGLVTAQMGQLPQGSSAILITPMVWHEILLAVDSLQRRSLRPVVILLMSQSFGNRASNEQLAQDLAARRVPVCKVYCDADLGETLSSFTNTTFSQEEPWRTRRPQFTPST